MAKNIFRTLKNYTHGFHSNATDEQIRVYDAKVAELTERIKADVEHAPEIIAEQTDRAGAVFRPIGRAKRKN